MHESIGPGEQPYALYSINLTDDTRDIIQRRAEQSGVNFTRSLQRLVNIADGLEEFLDGDDEVLLTSKDGTKSVKMIIDRVIQLPAP